MLFLTFILCFCAREKPTSGWKCLTDMVTISDVAKEAGVSVATVSRYLNNGPLSSESHKKVEEAIKKLAYKPNLVARALNMKSSKIVGFIIPSITNFFFTELYKSIDNIADSLGYHVMLCNAETIRKEEEFIDLLLSIRADGIITATGNCADIYRRIDSLPVVSVDRVIDSVKIHVSSNNQRGGEIAARHLYDCGCRKVAFIGAKNESESQHYRRKGFLAQCKALDMDAQIFLTKSEDARDSVEALRGELMKFDGIFAWNDYVAVQVLNSLYGTGVRVPEDIQLIGFDNTYLGSIFTPSLTTISQDIDQIGERAMKSLVNAISDSKNFQTQILVDVELIQRCTTRNPAIMRKNA